MNFYHLVRPILFSLDPEFCHNMAIDLLRLELIPRNKRIVRDNLRTNFAGLNFENPLGLAAGFDKNAEAINNLAQMGFGFIECGTITPKAQSGNPKPRMFRLFKDEAIINRLGFNNKGLDVFANNLSRSRYGQCKIGGNVGKNKDTAEDTAVFDYLMCIEMIYNLVSYITINISSPNTEGLRKLQHRSSLDSLLSEVVLLREALEPAFGKKPFLVKIAPDLNEKQIGEIIEVVLKYGIEGLIVSNTTTSRNNLKSTDFPYDGGLSGKPLFEISNKVLAQCYKMSIKKLAIIGVGGVDSAESAFIKIGHGATLVQIYSSLIYNGFGIVPKILNDLSELLEKNGFRNVNEAVGHAI